MRTIRKTLVDKAFTAMNSGKMGVHHADTYWDFTNKNDCVHLRESVYIHFRQIANNIYYGDLSEHSLKSLDDWLAMMIEKLK